MESARHEQQLPPPVVKTVRDRIVSFHDRYIKSALITEDAVGAFEQVSKLITSKKGQAAMERIRPHIADWSKNVEIWAGVSDMVLGVAGSVVAAEGLVGGLIEKRRAEKGATLVDSVNQLTAVSELKKDIRPNIQRGLGGAVMGGIFAGLRPVTHLAHRIGIPLVRRIALTVDTIMLKQEHKQQIQQVFVGRGKA